MLMLKWLRNGLNACCIQNIFFKGLIDFMEWHQTIPNPTCNVPILVHLSANKENRNEIHCCRCWNPVECGLKLKCLQRQWQVPRPLQRTNVFSCFAVTLFNARYVDRKAKCCRLSKSEINRMCPSSQCNYIDSE